MSAYSYSGTPQTFTVDHTGTYDIAAGETLEIVVGGLGTSGHVNGAGRGGGGSSVLGSLEAQLHNVAAVKAGFHLA